MRMMAGLLLYLIVVMLITIKAWCDEEEDLNFLQAFIVANLTILIVSGICTVCSVLLNIIITGTI